MGLIRLTRGADATLLVIWAGAATNILPAAWNAFLTVRGFGMVDKADVFLRGPNLDKVFADLRAEMAKAAGFAVPDPGSTKFVNIIWLPWSQQLPLPWLCGERVRNRDLILTTLDAEWAGAFHGQGLDPNAFADVDLYRKQLCLDPDPQAAAAVVAGLKAPIPTNAAKPTARPPAARQSSKPTGAGNQKQRRRGKRP